MRPLKYLLITLILMTCSCVARRTDGTVNFNASLTQTLLTYEATYEIVMGNVGRAHRAGLISFDTLERGRFLGQRVYNSIEISKTTLSIYLRTRGVGAYDEFASAVATLSTLMIQLERYHVAEIGEVP